VAHVPDRAEKENIVVTEFLPSCSPFGSPDLKSPEWVTFRALLVCLLVLVCFDPSARPAARPSLPRPEAMTIEVTVVDENGVAVPAARVTLTLASTDRAEPAASKSAFQGETDYAGRYQFTGVASESYRLRVDKEGFYEFVGYAVEAGKTVSIEVHLNHQKEFVESVNVVSSPPAIDPAKTTSSGHLGSREILDMPYTVTRDIRYALPLLPGVVQDGTGQLHVDGSYTSQTFDQLDGFNINAPASGQLTLRVNVDALRSVDVQDSRYAAEYGKGSGGILSLNTGIGDDHYRYTATDFLPSIQSRKGHLHPNTWTPRGSFSGPLRKGKAWFLLAPEGEYDASIVKELPPGADESTAWRFGNLAKVQVNLTPSNILTGSVLVNRFNAYNAGLSRFNPVETTVNEHESADYFSVKDQSLFANGALVEVGTALSRFAADSRPMGDQTYVIAPGGTSGNFFESVIGHSRRWQGIAHVVLPPRYAFGKHAFQVGTDLDRITYHQSFERRPFLVLRENGKLSREATFSGNSAFSRNNFEASAFAQDHWSLSDHLTVEPGIRLDWDEIVRDILVSPRLASSYLLTWHGDTKIVAGVGLYYDVTNLSLITLPLTGHRTDFFYDPTGTMVVGAPVVTSFQLNEATLKAPRVLNWSGGLERKLIGAVYTRLEFVEKRGSDQLAYFNPCTELTHCFSGMFEGRSQRRDRYDGATLSARWAFKVDHYVFVAYTRSTAHSNAVLNFNLANAVLGPQSGGPLPWDTPNRFVSWGLVPLRHRFDLAYWLDWRDGFPFALVNEEQQLVAVPGARRFPTYFSLNLALERRFVFFGRQWALRAGLNDVTNRHNPFAVDNNVDSPHFLSYSALQGRTLVARLRLVGRK